MPPGKDARKPGSGEKGKGSKLRRPAGPLVRAPAGRGACMTAFPPRQVLVWDRDGALQGLGGDALPAGDREGGCGVV